MLGEAAIDRFNKLALDVGEAEPMSPEAEARYLEYRGRRGKELELWKTWKEKGQKPEHLAPLVKSIQPLIRSETNKRMQGLGGSIPRAAIENELTNAAVKSLKTYNPNRGTALSTHVVGGFRRISDFVNANRNAKYVPSEDMKRYDAYRNAVSELRDELGRPPTAEEVRGLVPNWSVKTIKKMQRSFSPELYTGMGDELTTSDEPAKLFPRDAFYLAYPQLNEQERSFGNLYFPPASEAAPPIKGVAKTLGIPEHRAYRLKSRVESQMRKYIRSE